MLNGLSQTLLRATCPGVPDCYQGADAWDLRLVDPDNRGPVDFQKTQAALAALRGGCKSGCEQGIEAMLTSWRDARVKLHVFTKALHARKQLPELFAAGDYHPLTAEGTNARRVAAFARAHESDWAIVMAPRCVASVSAPVMGREPRREFWKDHFVTLPAHAPDKWVNVLAAKTTTPIPTEANRLRLADAFEGFPLALLVPARD